MRWWGSEDVDDVVNWEIVWNKKWRKKERAWTMIFQANTSWLCDATRRSQKSSTFAEKFAHLYSSQCIEQWKRAESTHNIDHVFDVISGTIYQHIILLHVACSVQHVQIKLNAARLWYSVCLTTEFASLYTHFEASSFTATTRDQLRQRDSKSLLLR